LHYDTGIGDGREISGLNYSRAPVEGKDGLPHSLAAHRQQVVKPPVLLCRYQPDGVTISCRAEVCMALQWSDFTK